MEHASLVFGSRSGTDSPLTNGGDGQPQRVGGACSDISRDGTFYFITDFSGFRFDVFGQIHECIGGVYVVGGFQLTRVLYRI